MSAPQTFPNAQAVVPNWYDDRRARVLLASIAERHPACDVRFDTYVTTRDEWSAYTGYRVECLDRIYAEHWRTYAKAQAERGDWDAFDAFAAQPTVQAVVSETVRPRGPSMLDTFLANTLLAPRPVALEVL